MSLIRCQTPGHGDRLCIRYWHGRRYCTECWENR